MTEKILVKDRPTARVLLVNAQDQVFLINTHFDPELGLEPRWLTPGGGIDAGESIHEAAVRELLEETGLKVSQEDLGELWWQTSGRWDWSDGIHYQTYTDSIFLLRVNDFELSNDLWTPEEHRDILESRWWNVSELIASGERVGPHGLADRLGLHLAS
ncbi:MAG: NUDIX domain-containing protein [Rhodoluna sp.]|nr:NUDIX domain-containing protein [Rhodoluna sp.]